MLILLYVYALTYCDPTPPFTLAVVGDTLLATIEEDKQVNEIANHLIATLLFISYIRNAYTSLASSTPPLPNPLPLSLPPLPPTSHTQEEERHLKRQRSESYHFKYKQLYENIILLQEIIHCIHSS